MKTSKKVLSLLLMLMMIFSLLPTVAFAETSNGNVAKIGNTEYATLNEALTAAKKGDTVEITQAGTYSQLPVGLNGFTILGGVKGVILDGSTSPSQWSNMTVKNVTVSFGQISYTGFQHNSNLRFEECVFPGLHFSYGNETYYKCTFNQTESEYNMWMYGTTVTYDECTFNCQGKCINVYNEGNSFTLKAIFRKCHFNSTEKNKSAVNVKETCGSTILKCNVSFQDCTIDTPTFFPTDKNGGSMLWMVDALAPEGKGETIVKVDGVKVWEKGAIVEAPIVAIGEGDDAKDAEVIMKQDYNVVTTGEGVAEEIKALDDETKNKIANNTEVTDVNLTTTAEEGKTSGLQAVVKTAIEQNIELAEAIKNAETVNVEVKVSVVPTQFVAPAAATQESPEQVGTVTFELKPTAIVTVGTGESTKSQEVDVDNNMIDQNEPITVSLYTGFEPAKIVHTGDDGFEEVFRPTGDKTFSYNNGVCTLQIHHFSKLTALSEDYVAKVTIGETTTNCKTLAAAVDAANKAGADSWDKAPVIELLESCEVQATHKLDNYGAVHFYANWGDVKDAYFILNGNNHTIKLTGEDPTDNKKGKFLTLKFSAGTHGKVSDLVIDANQKGHAAVDCVNSEVYLDNVTVKNTDGGWSAFNIVNSIVELKNCTATENVKQVISCDKGTKDAPSIAVIKSGTYDGTLRTEGTNEYNKLMIEGGKFSFASVNQNDNKQDMIIDEAAGSIIEISGGVFSKAPAANVLADDLKVADNTDENTKNDYPYMICPMEPVAKIGEKTYTTLAKAIAAAQDTKTEIKMIANEAVDVANNGSIVIPENKNIVLDLNGYEIAGVCSSGNGSALILNKGTLVVKDNTDTNKNGTGTGKLTYGATPIWVYDGGATYSGSYASNVITNHGKLTIESGLIKNASSGSAAYAVDNYYNGDIEITGGMLETAFAAAVRMFYGTGSLNITAGTLNSGQRFAVQVMGGSSKTTISGGIFNGRNGFVTYYGDEAKVLISGGTFAGLSYFYNQTADIDPEKVSVTGGRFESLISYNNTVGFISGGLYKNSTFIEDQVTYNLTDYLADGYVCVALASTDPAYTDGYRYIVKPVEVKIDPVAIDEENNVTVDGKKIDLEGAGDEGQPTAKQAADRINETLDNPEVTNFTGTNIEEATKVTDETTIQQVDDTEFDLSIILDEIKKKAAQQFADGNGSATASDDGEITVKTTDTVDGEKFNDTDITKHMTVDLTAAAVTKTVSTIVTSMTFDVKPIANITVINDAGESVTVSAIIPNEAITSPIKFRLPVDSGISEEWAAVYHKGEFIGSYKIQTENGNKFIELESMEFSEFSYVLVSVSEAKAKIGDVPYQTLAEAVAVVKTGETITLLADVSEEEIIVNRVVSFIVDNGEFTNSTLISAGRDYKLSETDGNYVFTARVYDCIYTKEINLSQNGTYSLKLGTCSKGEFTFEKYNNGWSIKNNNNKYLSINDGKLVLSDTPFEWTYKNKAFSATITTQQTVTSKVYSGLLSWLLGKNYTTKTTVKTVTTTYYLSTVAAGEKLSTCKVCAEIYKEVAEEHDFGCWIDCKDFTTHKHICKNCGKVESFEHDYDPDTHTCICGAYDPAAGSIKLSIKHSTKITKQQVKLGRFSYSRDFTTHIYTIEPEVNGLSVSKIEYSTNGLWYYNGSVINYGAELNKIKIRITDNHGIVRTYTYNGANVTED